MKQEQQIKSWSQEPIFQKLFDILQFENEMTVNF